MQKQKKKKGEAGDCSLKAPLKQAASKSKQKQQLVSEVKNVKGKLNININ